MRLATSQFVPAALPGPLGERLTQLGVVVAQVHADGRAAPLGECAWAVRVLLSSPVLTAAVRRQWEVLEGPQAGLTSLWSGLWMLPLPRQRRRRPGRPRDGQPLLAAVVIDRQIVTSEELHHVAVQARQDHVLLADALEALAVAGEAEARRLTDMIGWMHQDIREAERRDSELHTLSQQLSESYEELSMLYKLSTSMTLDRPPAQMLTEACTELQQVVGLRWMALQLVEDEPSLGDLAGQVFVAGPLECDAGLLRRIGGLLMQRYRDTSAPVVIDDTRSLNIPNLTRVAGQLLVVPLVREDKRLGLLLGGDKRDASHISSVDSKLCNALAASLAMFLENMILYEDTAAMFMGTLHALTAAIDAKDRYTFGHSERVAMLSRQLALAVGIDEHTAERAYLAGLVHDLGKIGVPEAVLCKTGKLSPEEFALIRMHPEIGARILQDIRQMQDLIPGVLYHHERMDGKGYPFGLAGDDIPLFGRLICLADSFDAMSSSRTYRSSLSLEEVLAEIRRCAGTQFDPELARVFLQFDLQPFTQMIRKHQAQMEVSARLPDCLPPRQSEVQA